MARLDPWFSLLSLGYMATLFYLSSLPGSAAGPNTHTWRFISNVGHVPMFAGLAVCLALAFRAWPLRRRLAWVVTVAVAYALFDEWHQGWVPGRRASVLDLGLDLAGVLLSLPWIYGVHYWRGRLAAGRAEL